MSVSKIRLNKKLVCFGGESESESVRSRDERSLNKSSVYFVLPSFSFFLTLDDGALILLQHHLISVLKFLFDINLIMNQVHSVLLTAYVNSSLIFNILFSPRQVFLYNLITEFDQSQCVVDFQVQK